MTMTNIILRENNKKGKTLSGLRATIHFSNIKCSHSKHQMAIPQTQGYWIIQATSGVTADLRRTRRCFTTTHWCKVLLDISAGTKISSGQMLVKYESGS